MTAMAEPKPLASLSSGLLARKGAARPAMRRQGLSPLHTPGLGQDDLGWNDMGYDVDPPKDAMTHRDAHNAPGSGLLAGAIPPQLHADDTDIADDHAVEAPIVEAPAVVQQRAALADRLAADREDAPVDLDDEAEQDRPVLAVRPAKRQALDLVRDGDDDAAADMPVEQVSAAKAPAERPMPSLIDRSAAVAAVASHGRARRAAFTLRLDPDRHLKLRLACAVSGRSAQQLVTEAVDDLLRKIPDIEDLADRVAKGDRSAD